MLWTNWSLYRHQVGAPWEGSSELGAQRCNPGWHGPGSAGARPSYPAALVVAVTKLERHPSDVLHDPVIAFAAGVGRAGVDGGDHLLRRSFETDFGDTDRYTSSQMRHGV